MYFFLYNSKIIGGINLEYWEDRNACEIGWVIHHDYRNQGFTTEAASAVFRFAFEDLNLDEDNLDINELESEIKNHWSSL